jgi:hypothetical protein
MIAHEKKGHPERLQFGLTLFQHDIAMGSHHIGNLNQTVRMANPKKLDRLLEYLKDLNEEKFTGSIKINFTQGSIARVERFEEISKKLIHRKV